MQEMQEIWVRSLGREIPWRTKLQPTPVFTPGESHGQRVTGSWRVRHHWGELAHTPLFSYPPEWSKEGTYQDDPRSNTSFLILYTCRNMQQADLGSWATCDLDWGGRWFPYFPGPKPSDTLCLKHHFFSVILFKYWLIDLTALGLSCSTWDLWSLLQDL